MPWPLVKFGGGNPFHQTLASQWFSLVRANPRSLSRSHASTHGIHRAGKWLARAVLHGGFPATLTAAPASAHPELHVQALADLPQLTEDLALKEWNSPPTEWLSHYPTQQWPHVFLLVFQKIQKPDCCQLLSNIYECRLVLLTTEIQKAVNKHNFLN